MYDNEFIPAAAPAVIPPVFTAEEMPQIETKFTTALSIRAITHTIRAREIPSRDRIRILVQKGKSPRAKEKGFSAR